MEILLKREKEIKLKMAHHFFNPIAIAKGYMNLMADAPMLKFLLTL